MSYDEYQPNRGLFGLGIRWWVWLLGLIVVLTVITVPVGLGLGWFNRAAQVYGPENVSQQWQQGYDYYNALKGTAQNICTFEKAAATAIPGTPAADQRQSQLLAQQTLYQTNSRKYDGFMADPLRAKLVRPSDLPATAPTEAEMKAQVCAR